MNENYLWDKTGSDSEIEKLENALLAFRYTETAAPALPAKVLPFKSKTPRSFFRLGFAFAACTVLVLIGAGVWNRVSNNNSKVETDSAKIVAPQESAPLIRQPIIENKPDSVIESVRVSSAKKSLTARRLPKQKIFKTRKVFPSVDLKDEIIARNNTAVESSVKLTREEKFAYNQLMLALSITSAKLKIVKDKAESLEN